VTIKVYSDTSVDNTEQSTLNEYIFGQQRSVLFQENYQRSQNEQKINMAWQQAVSGWRLLPFEERGEAPGLRIYHICEGSFRKIQMDS
jgi:hypothetical protein